MLVSKTRKEFNRLKYTVIAIPALLLGVSWGAHAQASGPTRVGIIHIQNAIIGTKDGQKAAKELQEKFAPTRARLEKKQADIEADRAKLNQGSNAMSAEQKEKLMRDIDQKTKSLNRDTEDAQAELDTEQGKIMQELGQRIMAVIDKYSKDKGYSLIIDVSSQQTPVMFASNDVDITSDIVKLYDQNSPGAVTSGPPPTSTPKPVAPKPAIPAPVKKAP
jgi:outer membrane protein